MATTTRICTVFSLAACAALALGGCNDNATWPASSTPSNATSGALSISGNPVTSAAVGSSYVFRPTVINAGGSALIFSIHNQPAWATFDTTTGTLSGTPSAANLGVSPPISILASNGTSSAVLAAFSIDVTQGATNATGVASLTWTAPPTNANGVEDVAGYHIYFGADKKNLSRVVNVDGGDSATFTIKDLPSGTWYFGITSYNVARIESSMSAIVPVTI